MPDDAEDTRPMELHEFARRVSGLLTQDVVTDVRTNETVDRCKKYVAFVDGPEGYGRHFVWRSWFTQPLTVTAGLPVSPDIHTPSPIIHQRLKDACLEGGHALVYELYDMASQGRWPLAPESETLQRDWGSLVPILIEKLDNLGVSHSFYDISEEDVDGDLLSVYSGDSEDNTPYSWLAADLSVSLGARTGTEETFLQYRLMLGWRGRLSTMPVALADRHVDRFSEDVGQLMDEMCTFILAWRVMQAMCAKRRNSLHGLLTLRVMRHGWVMSKQALLQLLDRIHPLHVDSWEVPWPVFAEAASDVLTASEVARLLWTWLDQIPIDPAEMPPFPTLGTLTINPSMACAIRVILDLKDQQAALRAQLDEANQRLEWVISEAAEDKHPPVTGWVASLSTTRDRLLMLGRRDAYAHFAHHLRTALNREGRWGHNPPSMPRYVPDNNPPTTLEQERMFLPTAPLSAAHKALWDRARTFRPDLPENPSYGQALEALGIEYIDMCKGMEASEDG